VNRNCGRLRPFRSVILFLLRRLYSRAYSGWVLLYSFWAA